MVHVLDNCSHIVDVGQAQCTIETDRVREMTAIEEVAADQGGVPFANGWRVCARGALEVVRASGLVREVFGMHRLRPGIEAVIAQLVAPQPLERDGLPVVNHARACGRIDEL